MTNRQARTLCIQRSSGPFRERQSDGNQDQGEAVRISPTSSSVLSGCDNEELRELHRTNPQSPPSEGKASSATGKRSTHPTCVCNGTAVASPDGCTPSARPARALTPRSRCSLTHGQKLHGRHPSSRVHLLCDTAIRPVLHKRHQVPCEQHTPVVRNPQPQTDTNQ